MQPLFIGPADKGVENNLKPFMIPENAFPDMENAFVWRNRIERKAGYTLLGRLQRTVTVTALALTGDSVNLVTGLGLESTASIAPGSISLTGSIDGTLYTDPAQDGTLTATGGTGTGGTINYATGVITITGGGAETLTGTIGYYPGLPVMGIRTREIPNVGNNDLTVFFDTKYAYQFTSGFSELPSTLATTWSGTNAQQFWSTNYQTDASNNVLFWETNNVPGLHQYAVTAFTLAAAGPPSTVSVTAAGNTFQLGDIVFFNNLNVAGAVGANNAKFGVVTTAGNPTFIITNPATNYFTNEVVTGMALTPNRNISGDGIRYYNGTTWANLDPILNIPSVVNNAFVPGNNLAGALMIIPYHGRLVVLNTFEGNSSAAVIRYPQRARWSQLGSVLDLVNGWRDDIVGRGGFDDAATEEAIVSCGFVKDELIVYFERSTWKLIYTANESGQPFVWQRISSELGAESTFSNVQFDRGLLAVGNVGVHQCNGSEVKRIDQVIPNEVFDIHNGTDGPLRVSAIRDFYQEIVYFAYPQNAANTDDELKVFYPNRMMIYNYVNNTFSFFTDNATTFGYFQRVLGLTWAMLTRFTWEEWNIAWNSGVLQAGFPSICFGNQQGFVEIMSPDLSSVDDSLYISAISGSTVTSPQHNLFVGQYVYMTHVNGVVLRDLSGNIESTFLITTVPNRNTFTIDGTATGAYTGAGQIEVVDQLFIPTKQFTPFWTQGKNYNLKYFDILVDATDAGELQVDVYVDFNTTLSTSAVQLLGTSTISTAPASLNLPYYRFQAEQDQIWTRFYTFATGETFQLAFSFNDTELRDRLVRNSDVVIHAIICFFEPAGDFY